jgi:ERCC4-type nuclease
MSTAHITGIFVDSREPPNIQKLDFGGAPKIITSLDAGDLWVSTSDKCWLVVERKTPDDLLNSIADGRLLPQVGGMRRRSQWCYLVVTGLLTPTFDGKTVTDHRTTGWDWNSVQGALLSVQEMGVAVVTCLGDSDYEPTICRLAHRQRGEHVLEPRLPARFLTPGEQILTSLPGIGLERAQTLLAEFHNETAQALCWLTWTSTFHEVAGIGDKTKGKVREALGLSADAWLTIHHPQAAHYAADHLLEESHAAAIT